MSDLLQFTDFGGVAAIKAGPPGVSEPGVSLHSVVWDSVAGKAYTCTDPTLGSQTWAPSLGVLSTSSPVLFSMYTMDNIVGAQLIDESVNNNDASLISTTIVPGHLTNGITLAPSGTITPNNRYIENQGALSAWVRFPDTASFNATNYLFSTGVDGSNFLVVTVNSGFIRLQYSLLGDFSEVVTASANIPNDTSWHHIVIQQDGTGVEIYLDGVVRGTINNSGTEAYLTWFSSHPVGGTHLIGGLNVGSLSVFTGELDQFRLYTRALSPSEITELYNET